MADFARNHIYATIHDFKTNISRYIRLLEAGSYKGVIVNRYNKPIAVFGVLSPRRLFVEEEDAESGSFAATSGTHGTHGPSACRT